MKLFDVADRYCKESSWKTLALLKFCLFSIGLMVGMQVPKEKRKAVYGAGMAIFLVTYIPLMAKFFRLWTKKWEETYEHFSD